MDGQIPHAACLGARRRERPAARRGLRGFLSRLGSALARRLALRGGLLFLIVAVAHVIVSPHPALAAPPLALLCPQGGGEPKFQDQFGNVFPIRDPGDNAIAVKACNPNLAQGASNISVSVTNNNANTIYVAFTNYSTQLPGQITWSANCTVFNSQATIPNGTTCTASVPATAGLSRFCAFTSQLPAGQSPNCNLAQAHNQTMVETNFGTGSNGVCYPSALSSCVWYDISVIPQNCTPAAWSQNYCQNTGGASYNLPVSLACSGEPTYTCKGPPSSVPYGNANYPSNCGNPAANCTGNSPSCDNAYFWPNPSPSPNAQCLPGQTLLITFLSGS